MTPAGECAYAVIDAGTTRTRLRLWAAGQVQLSLERQVGAANVARDGHAGALHGAVSDLLDQARALGGVQAVLASGMIGSEIGLLDVPHVSAPASYADLTRALLPHDFPDLGRVNFVPGVKTVPTHLAPETLHLADLMRGEEVEVIGLRARLGLRGEVQFMHYGSHAKLIRTDDAGILGSVTTLHGELLSGLSGHSVLKSSVTPLTELTGVDDSWWRRGLEASVQHGFGRACFMVRLARQQLRCAPDEAASFLLGAVASLDLPLLSGDAALVLYGRGSQTEPMARHLRQMQPGRHITVASETDSAQAAVIGAVHLYEARHA